MSVHDSDIAPVAALPADRGRAAMPTALLDGRPPAAGEPARVARISAQTAGAHLARPLSGGPVTVVKQGRHRYYRLRGSGVAQAVEALTRINPPLEAGSLGQAGDARRLHRARSCYDHLAGVAGVTLFTTLMDGGLIEGDGVYEVTANGEERLEIMGLDAAGFRRRRRRFAGHCRDRTERRPHLNGALRAALLAPMVGLGRLERGRTRHALEITRQGRSGPADVFGCVL
ncbi:transcriptional regulator [Actinomadura sp. NBRC 104425]|uniref:ArsR/SmtB family transcription factor n=1 Tax=Actinomadura sp. NBRC 104425 TaxID=3032204 RepID=UPI0024A45F1B|nr:helix-turn-helix domain-containing protein [Actinomadura sp. NBRC 104425]GLZ12030.1 transcriptional regulator [Actinomadura sp. NBRC 104425]